MTMNSSGPISLGGSTAGQSVNLEIQNTATQTISFNDAKVRTLTGTSAGGQLSMPNQFYSTSYAYLMTYLVVAGGGGGGTYFCGGGGGAGGVLNSNANVLPGTALSIVVGSGGSQGANGGDSSFNGLYTYGGGYGGSGLQVGGNGGSGGGGGYAQYGQGANTWAGGSGVTGQGNAGGTGVGQYNGVWAGGGGGGAGGIGGSENFGQFYVGTGGPGTTVNIGGVNYTVGGGGGGGGTANGSGGSYPSAGGSGGGGAGGVNGTNGTGGGGGAVASGGSGIVVIAIPTARFSGVYTGSPTIITSGSNTILQFYANGSYTT